MRKYVARGLIALVVLVALLVGTAFWYVRTGRFDLWLTGFLIRTAADYGARVEIDRLESNLTGLGVKLGGVRVYPEGSDQPVAEVEEITANGVINNLWRQDFALENLQLLRPKVWVRFDAEGVPNFAKFHRKRRRPTTPGEEREKDKARYAHVRLLDATVFLADVQRKISGEARGLSLELVPAPPLSNEPNRLKFSAGNAHLTFDGKTLNEIKAELAATFDNKRADVQALVIESPISKTTLRGEVSSLKEAAYRFDAATEVNLGETGKIFAPDAGLIGMATFTGQVTGRGTQYQATGEFKADKVAARDVNATALKLSGGVTGQAGEFKFDGQLAVDRIRYQAVNFGSLRADITADGRTVKVGQFSAGALGGQARGQAEIALESGAGSSLAAALTAVNLGQAIQLATRKPAPVTGTASTEVNLSWQGLDFDTITGRVAATFTGATRPTAENARPAPFSGRVAVLARGDVFDLRQVRVAGAGSQTTVTGTITRDLFAALKVNFKAANMAAAQEVARGFGLIPESVNASQLALSGPGSFAGTVRGKLTAPAVAGQLALDAVAVQGEPVGRLVASIRTSPAQFVIEGGSLVRPDGSRADFSLSTVPGRKNATGAQASLRNIDLGFLVKLIDPERYEALAPLAGKLNGRITVGGLPGQNVEVFGWKAPVGGVRGRLDIQMAELVVKGEPVERAGGVIEFAESTLAFKDLAVRFRGGQFAVGGSFNLETRTYELSARAQGLSLDFIKEAQGGEFPATGAVNVELVGQGDLEGPGFRLVATGQNIKLRDEAIENPRLVVDAHPGQNATLDLTATVSGQPRHITGTISDLVGGEPKLHAEEVLTNTAIRPYLALFTRLPEGITGTVTGKVSVDGDPFDYQAMTATLDLQSLDLNLALGAGLPLRLQNQGPISVIANTRRIEFNQFRVSGDGTDLALKGVASLDPDVPGTVEATGQLNLGVVGVLLSASGEIPLTTGGTTVGRAQITGSARDPKQVAGAFSLEELRELLRRRIEVEK